MEVLAAEEIRRADHALDDGVPGVGIDDLEKVVRQALAELPLGARRQEPGRLTPSQIEPDAAHGEPVVQGETSAVARVRRQPGRPRSSTEMHTIPDRPYGPPDELRAQLPSRSHARSSGPAAPGGGGAPAA